MLLRRRNRKKTYFIHVYIYLSIVTISVNNNSSKCMMIYDLAKYKYGELVGHLILVKERQVVHHRLGMVLLPRHVSLLTYSIAIKSIRMERGLFHFFCSGTIRLSEFVDYATTDSFFKNYISSLEASL